MRARIVIGMIVGLLGVGLAMAQDKTSLSELQQLKAEVQRLQEQLLQSQYQLATCQAQTQAAKLAQQRAALEGEFRDALKAPSDARFDWDKLSFAKPESK